MTIPAIPLFILADLARVDMIIRDRIEPQTVVLRAAGHHLSDTGSIQQRAIVTLLAAHLGAYETERLLHAAAAIELLYVASLVHDDLIDEAERRRGVVPTQHRWSGDVALMTGDYLLALAASEMALAPDPRIIAYFSQALMAICEGQLAPVMDVAPFQAALDQYLFKIGSKTAALFEAGCKAGMVCGGGTAQQIEALGRFGYDLGLASAISSDVQTLADDLQKGVITMPLIYAVEMNATPELRVLLDQQQIDDSQIAWAVAEIQRVGGDQRAIEQANSAARRARAQLDFFPDSPAKEALAEWASLLGARDVGLGARG